jgi:uncharacterized protein YlxW (UPF0749 family)
VPGRRIWRVLVPIACLGAGLLFAVSAHTARGTDLRSPESANLAELVRSAEGQVNTLNNQLTTLQNSVTGLTTEAGRQNSAVAAAQLGGAGLLTPGGLTAVSGPGIRVVLDDSHGLPAGVSSQNIDPNQLVVHQSDLQAVVNALWAGGAEAMTISGQRIIATSAVRCVGNTLF